MTAGRCGKLQGGYEGEVKEISSEAAGEEEDVKNLIQDIPEAIRDSLEGLDRITEIVRAMKKFSSSGAQKKEAIDINKAVANTIAVSRNEWKKVAEMVTMFDQDMPPVACFHMDFNLMILNIIMNAVYAIRDVHYSPAPWLKRR